MKEIEKAYEASRYEDAIYSKWEKSGAFTPKIVKNKKPFVISMPPPNATGVLHLGHATMLALEDTMVRYKRMKGFPTLWVPGTDHASIATQNKVEKIIEKEGETRHSLGREAFLERVDSFVEESRGIIRKQIRKMGSSCDWTRERYTMDKGLSKAVGEVFVRMYRDGLIYRGNRIVNWCTRCGSTLADDEVGFKEEKAPFYYIKYGPVVIGTARPETKFLDKIIVAHPDDKRYKKLFGKKFTIPWITGEIEAVFLADKSADPEFGTGAMTLTPAHDFIDFDIAKKHKLEVVQIIGPDGRFTDVVGPDFAGKNARESRKEIVKILEKKDLLVKVDDNYVHNLSVCYRCGTPIEPLISKQWFIDVNKPVIKSGKKKVSLKKKSIEAVRNKKIEIIPERFNKTYFHWMNNLRDWCISRQIWFGHRIPVWYCESGKDTCKEPIISTARPEKCPSCGSRKLHQDPDTLDTWFSSGLWTFSTLGWPEKTADLKYFHPTSVLETGYDILFFWIARMILMTSYALNEIPFEKVYLHGLVMDKNGKKMSKSSGNGIDPLDMIQKFGTDAVRLSFLIGTSPGNDFRLYEEKIAGFRNFVNKIWNSARFALLNLPDKADSAVIKKKTQIKSHADKWIVTKLQKLIRDVDKDMENYSFSEAGTRIYNFTWGEFCDWYLEISKGEQMNPAVLRYVLKNLLKLLHPYVPFVTEAIWSHLGEPTMLIGEKWPAHDKTLLFPKEEKEMEAILELITSIRSIRAEKGVEPAKKINAVIYGGKFTPVLNMKKNVIVRLARLDNLVIEKKGPKITDAVWKYVRGMELYLPVSDLFDIDAEKKRLAGKIDAAIARMSGLKNRLNNKGFMMKAPPEIVKKEKEQLVELENELNTLQIKINELNSYDK